MKLLETGDLHIKDFKGQGDRAAAFARTRLDALQNVIQTGEEQDCSVIVDTGDTFDSRSVSAELVTETAQILNQSPCLVLVLPGNHDYLKPGDDPFWDLFRRETADAGKVVLLSEEKPYVYTFGPEKAAFYPAICRQRNSTEGNSLGWIKDLKELDPGCLHVGVAHGALEGVSMDDGEGRYYPMTQEELENIPMDLWLIGHTHVPYPAADPDTPFTGSRIFNAGTHAQLSVNNHTPGSVFVLETGGSGTVTAVRRQTGVYRYVAESLHVTAQESLADQVSKAFSGEDAAHTLMRLTISGTASTADYRQRAQILEKAGEPFFSFEAYSDGLTEQITAEMIRSCTMEGTPENALLNQYLAQGSEDSLRRLALAFGLVRDAQIKKEESR